MITIVSRRHPLKFYFVLTFGTIFFVGLGGVLFYLFIHRSNTGILRAKDYLAPLVGGVSFFMAWHTLVRYFKNVPKIVVDAYSISFNRRSYFLRDIQSVKLTGKHPFPYIIYYEMEAATLLFNDGKTIHIYDDMYANAAEIKSFLKQVVIDKKDFSMQQTAMNDPAVPEHEIFETFKNNQFTSLRGILLWGMFSLFMYLVLASKRSPNNAAWIFIIAFSIFWTGFNGWLMHYFEISERFFVVRNHIFFWKRKAYFLDDIKEVVYETRHKMPNCLRVITKNFNNKLYPAGTLGKKTWLAMKDKLETHKIKVRNECI